MQIRMRTMAAGPAGVWPAGAVVIVEETVGRALVAAGAAEAVGRVVPAAPVQETAAVVVPETPERGRVSPQSTQRTQRPEQRRTAKVQKGKG